MSETVLDVRQVLGRADRGAETLRAHCRMVVSRAGFGKAPQTAPDSGRRPLLQQDLAAAGEHEHDGVPVRKNLARPRRWQRVDQVFAACHAIGSDRALAAAWIASGTYR